MIPNIRDPDTPQKQKAEAAAPTEEGAPKGAAGATARHPMSGNCTERIWYMGSRAVEGIGLLEMG